MVVVTSDPTKTKRQYRMLLCCACEGLMIDWFNRKRAAKPYERERTFRLISVTNLMHNFFIPESYILHYTPRHVSSIVVLIFRRKIVYLQYLVSSHSLSCHTVHWLRADCARYGSLQSVTIPDTVYIQFSFLLKMSTTMLETCRGV